MGETKQTYHFVVTLQELKQRAEKNKWINIFI